ncbi:DUF4400 domain-containing protein [Deferribacter autotrophicus]|uniref:DUF4400 domain-containing protein n=1 Tax=Deferribacter autotrophicus TaxID=500465 RepID=A0A5A8F3I9_9BACT|nr:DUF4400 domain-containing protein [Deferribacter autotrophicus]KAA0257554.1 DUF4400 domain-containing protein [Deferribacter autotrophicus]
MSEVATVSTFRYWIVFFLLIIIAGEFFIYKYKSNNNPDYKWNLLVKEQEHFKMVADKEDIEFVINVTNFIDNFMKGALRRAYYGVEGWFKPIMQLSIIRLYMYKFMLPLLIAAIILGLVEGNLRYKKKIEKFEITSSLKFHWILRLALAMKLMFIFGYVFSPIPVNPFLFIYGIPLTTLMVVYLLRANLPLEKL